MPCKKQGGIKFNINGNPYFNLVLVYNVAGGGNVYAMAMKGGNSAWCTMGRNWGQNWQSSVKLTGQGLSFRVTLGSGKMLVFNNVAPSSWQFGQTYQASSNFWSTFLCLQRTDQPRALHRPNARRAWDHCLQIFRGSCGVYINRAKVHPLLCTLTTFRDRGGVKIYMSPLSRG